jgi:hypothetical protein
MKRMMLAACLSVMVLPATLRAQSRSDFTGRWGMDPTRSESANQGPPIGSVVLVIRQTAAEVAIDTIRSDNTRTVTYKLDGSETVTPQVTSTMRWDGTKLITTTTYLVTDGWILTLNETRSLDAGGKEMTVETTVVLEHGYTGGTSSKTDPAGGYRPVKDVFVKVTP